MTLVYWEINLKTDTKRQEHVLGSCGLCLAAYTNFSTANWWCHFVCQSLSVNDTWLTKKTRERRVEFGWCALCSLPVTASVCNGTR